MSPVPLVLPRVAPPSGKRAIYYHTEWSIYARNYFVKDLPIDSLVDLAFAFLEPKATGELVIRDPWASTDNPFIPGSVDPQNTWSSPPEDRGLFGQFRKLIVNQGKKFNLAVSIGGWTLSGTFSDIVATEQSRSTFVNSLTAFLTKYPIFNGVSIDWEYLSDDGVNHGLDGNISRPEDGKNFIILMKQLREALPNYMFAFCCNAAPEKSHWPIEDVIPLLDELHVMTYDFHDGNWGETTTAHHTNLLPSSAGKWSAQEGVEFYLSRGVPASKIFIGGALYSRGFANTDGIGKPASGRSPHMSWEEGIVDYKKLPLAGGEERFDEEAKAAYAYYPSERVVDTYDNLSSITAKVEYINSKDLGGIILWETSGDFEYSNPRSIMKALHDKLTHAV